MRDCHLLDLNTALGFPKGNRIGRLSAIDAQNNSSLSHMHLEFKIPHVNTTELKNEEDYAKRYAFSHSLL